MVKINGFKVIGPTEVVVGKVVELSKEDLKEESTVNFRLVEYYVNEYQTYLHRNLATFAIDPQKNVKDYLKTFKKVLGEHARISEVFVEKSVMELFTK